MTNSLTASTLKAILSDTGFPGHVRHANIAFESAEYKPSKAMINLCPCDIRENNRMETTD